MAAYFSVYKGQEEGLAKLALSTHDTPCVQRAYELLKTTWIDVRATSMEPQFMRPTRGQNTVARFACTQPQSC